MKRLSFLASLFGFAAVAKAQHPVAAPKEAANSLTRLSWPWEDTKPLNNQCPVCGTMAKEYHQPTLPIHNNCHSVRDDATITECDTLDVKYGQIDLITRCKRCNNAFYQEAV